MLSPCMPCSRVGRLIVPYVGLLPSSTAGSAYQLYQLEAETRHACAGKARKARSRCCLHDLTVLTNRNSCSHCDTALSCTAHM